MRWLRGICLFAAAAASGRGEIIDRVVAVVGRQVITGSQVEREARLEAYFNGQPPPGAERPAAATRSTASETAAGDSSAVSPARPYADILQRLIDQRLIWYEMEQTKFPTPDDAEARKRLAQLEPSAARKPADYGLRESDLVEYARRVERLDRFLKLRLQERDVDDWLKGLRSRVRVRVMEKTE